MKQRREEPLTLDMPFDEAVERFVRVSPKQPDVEAPPEPGRATPFVKWAGGKRSIIDELASRLPTAFNGYWEPFLGGGALFFELHDRLITATLSDTNLALIITYSAVKKQPDALIAKLEEHQRKSDEDYYYKVRAQQNLQDPVEIAARFIYLNKTGYNGLYRVNKSGEFNVPWGRYTNPDIVGKENILACSKALQKTTIEYRDFDTITPQPGDFVYCDPPYHPVASSSFTKYTQLDFSEKDQERLRNFAAKLSKQGVKVMLSNSDTPFIRNLYSGRIWHIAQVEAPRMVNCKPEGRGAVEELIITNYSTA